MAVLLITYDLNREQTGGDREGLLKYIKSHKMGPAVRVVLRDHHRHFPTIRRVRGEEVHGPERQHLCRQLEAALFRLGSEGRERLVGKELALLMATAWLRSRAVRYQTSISFYGASHFKQSS